MDPQSREKAGNTTMLSLTNIKVTLITIKITLALVFLLVLLIASNKLPEQKYIKKLRNYKNVIIIIFVAILFLWGFYISGKHGDIFYASLYPLYVSILVASVGSVKYRSLEIDAVAKKHLLMELKWGALIFLIALFMIILIHMKLNLAPGILLALNLLLLGYLFNLGLVYTAFSKKKSN